MTSYRQDELAITQQAVEWYTALEEGSAAEQTAFSEWLAQSPLHVREFLNVTAVHRLFDNLDRGGRIEVDSLLTKSPDNVISLSRTAESSVDEDRPTSLQSDRAGAARFGQRSSERQMASGRDKTSRLSSKRLFWPAAAAIVAVSLSLLWWQAWSPGKTYATAAGEQLAIELDDGSLVNLNGQSRLRVDFDAGRRDVHLLQGEALFNVHHDPSRPFRVEAGDAVIQVIGTEFNVNRRVRDTAVSVIEGVVQVTGTAQAPTRFSAGEEARITKGGTIAQRSAVDAKKVAEWRERRLVFHADTLEDIAVEFNRYNRAPKIRIESDAIGQRRFTGVVDADRPESLLELLTEADNLTAERRGSEIVVRAR